ncbi:putative SP-containing protein [Vairimorpha necatrix]|uniref:SP-containing protein n=1 Tax=Vairimorpha necatrix TaxID=6039 RepID=A0AAX4J9A3_9MICR
MFIFLVVTLSVFTYFYLHFRSLKDHGFSALYKKDNITIINDTYIDKLHIPSTVDELYSRCPRLSKEQYKNILIALRIYSNFRTSWLDDYKESINFKANKKAIDEFMSSLNEFVFLKENGIKECCDGLEKEHLYICGLLTSLVPKDKTFEINTPIEKYLEEPFASLKKQAEDMWDENIKNQLYKEMIKITHKGKDLLITVDSYVWIRLFVYFDIITALELH